MENHLKFAADAQKMQVNSNIIHQPVWNIKLMKVHDQKDESYHVFGVHHLKGQLFDLINFSLITIIRNEEIIHC